MAAVTVADVVNAVLAAAGSEAGPPLAATWVDQRYRELCNRTRLRHLRRSAELIQPAVIDDGLVTATAGSPVLVGDTDARTAWNAQADAVIDRFIRITGERNWYRIVGLTASNDLRLSTPYVLNSSDAVAADDAAYKLVARYLPLERDVRWMGIVAHPRLAEPLNEINHQELDITMTSRILVADLPRFWCEAPPAEDGTKRIEVYPYVNTDQLLRYSYTAIAPPLTLDSPLPPEIDLHILKQGALVDLYRWEMAQAARRNQPDIAALWRNEMNSSTTRWEDKIREAIKADHASDVNTFQMLTQGFPPGGSERLIRDAKDYVWARGNRP